MKIKVRTVAALFSLVLLIAAEPALLRSSACGAEPTAAPATAEPFFFIQMSDPQLGLTANPLFFSRFEITWIDDFTAETATFEKAIEAANRMRPAFIVMTGDLVNDANHDGQLAEFERIRAKLSPDIPLYLLPGNHDVGNHPTRKSLEQYRSRFGNDWYSFQHGNVYGIVINSEIVNDPKKVADEAAEQLAWFEAELQKAQREDVAHILVFQHRPLFIESPDELGWYFNISMRHRGAYLKLLRKYGVDGVFSGHLHRNIYRECGDIELVTTGAIGMPMGDDPSGFRVVEVFEDRIAHRYLSLDEALELGDDDASVPLAAQPR